MSLEQIENLPNHRKWGEWMNALAFFKLKKKYFSLDDVPDEHKVWGNTVDIREPGKLTTYMWDGEKWEDAGSVHDEFYKM